MGTGVGDEDGVSVGVGTLGVLVGIGVSVAVGPGVKVGLGVLVGVGTGVGALAIREVSGQPRHPNALPKANTAMRITNGDLFITMLFSFSSQTVWPAPINFFRISSSLAEFQLLWPEIPCCWY